MQLQRNPVLTFSSGKLLARLNKLMKSDKDLAMYMVAVWCANRTGGSSSTGPLIAAFHPDILKCETALIFPSLEMLGEVLRERSVPHSRLGWNITGAQFHWKIIGCQREYPDLET